MLGILLDMAMLAALLYVINEGEVPSIGPLFLTVIAISLGFFACGYFLSEYLGILSLVSMAIVGALILWIACELTVKQASIAGVVMLVYKVALTLLFEAVLS